MYLVDHIRIVTEEWSNVVRSVFGIDKSEVFSDYRRMRHAEAIRAFGDDGTRCAAALSAEMGAPVDREAVYKWRLNDRIPPKYWRALEAAAVSAGIEGITLQSLAANYRAAA